MGLYQITAPHFVAGVETKAGKIIEAAPILKQWIGCVTYKLRYEAATHGWKVVKMAKRGGSKPTHYIAVTAPKGRGDGFEKGPYIGLWEGDGNRNSPLFRGSCDGKYLDELYDFIKDFGDSKVSFAIFESRDNGGGGRERERDDSDRGNKNVVAAVEADRAAVMRTSPRGRGRDNDRPSNEREPSNKRGAGKKGDDWFDND